MLEKDTENGFWIDFGYTVGMKLKLFCAGLLFLILSGCMENNADDNYSIESSLQDDSIVTISSDENETVVDTIHGSTVRDSSVPVKTVSSHFAVESVVKFAETLIGIPYKYASTDPARGFDCSGFITYVFNHFNIKVPRSSIDFTNVGTTVPLKDAKRGDLILFTGTDSTEKFVGHMGIITFNADDSVKFIHSTSGKAYGVTITPLNNYYMGRFVKVIRIDPANMPRLE